MSVSSHTSGPSGAEPGEQDDGLPPRKLVRAHIEPRDYMVCKRLAAKNHWSLDFVVRRIIARWVDLYTAGEDIGVDVGADIAAQVSADNAGYNEGWDAAVAQLAACLERQRERMTGREFRTVVAQMELMADIAEEMEIARLWGHPIGGALGEEKER